MADPPLQVDDANKDDIGFYETETESLPVVPVTPGEFTDEFTEEFT